MKTHQPNVLYKRAPFVEIIAEIKWALKPLASVPGGGIDPFYDDFKDAITALFKDGGFGVTEALVPDQIPYELTGHQVRSRFRENEGEWPVYQIGPGILSANWARPYLGWNKFYEHLANGISAIFEAYPVSVRYLNLSEISLRYINAFPLPAGGDLRAKELREMLNVDLQLGEGFEQIVGAEEQPTVGVDIVGQLRNLPGTKSRLKCSGGKLKQDAAVIVQTVAEMGLTTADADQVMILNWFNEAHAGLNEMFHALITERTLESIGPAEEVCD